MNRHCSAPPRPSLGPLTFTLAVWALLAGCSVPVHRQRLLARPNMQFSDSPVFSYQSRVLPQIETGAAATGGAQAAGCTSCR